MDRKINSRTPGKKLKIIWLVVFLTVSVSLVVYAVSDTNAVTIDASQIRTTLVRKADFQKGVIVTGQIRPSEQTFLDAGISGIVEKVYVRSGDNVSRGDTLLRMSNSDLRLEVLQRESQLLEQLNTQRQTRILINQNDLSQKQQLEEINFQLQLQGKRYRRNKELMEGQFIAGADFEEIEERYKYYQSRKRILLESFRTDSLARQVQLKQLDASEKRLQANLKAVRQILDQLFVIAPVSGKLSDLTLSNGELITEGQRLGLIYNLKKPVIEAAVDELYINDLNKGLEATLLLDGSALPLKLSKKFPAVSEGNFRIELEFKNQTDTKFYNGQTVRVRISLSNPREALVISKGRFYSNTGGQWIFVLKDGEAKKREIQIGQQNDLYFEVERGLFPGEEVIISEYDNYEEYSQLKIN